MLPELYTLYLPIALMTLFGVPHGALDGYLLRSQSDSKRHTLALLMAYLGIAIACVLFWWWQPTLALLSFLLLSLYHFGRSDHLDGMGPVSAPAWIAHGGLWTLFLPWQQAAATSAVFDALKTDPLVLELLLTPATAIWALVSGIYLWQQWRNKQQQWHIWVLAVATIICLPPLWSLSLYFCLWHARRHTRWVLACAKSPAEAKIWMLSIFSLTIIMGAAAYLLWLPTTAASTLTAQIFFIGIFALTVPHMILIDYYLGNLCETDSHSYERDHQRT